MPEHSLPSEKKIVKDREVEERKQEAPAPVPMTTKGQRYAAPVGRHSQQTHRRAQERAEAGGHATEKEQHDHDRGMVQADLSQRSQQQLNQQQSNQQREQNERSAAKKAKAQPDPQETKQE